MKDGGPAFPMSVLDQDDGGNLSAFETQYGMTLRDYFAAAAISGMSGVRDCKGQFFTPATLAESAYQIADAMLAARGA